MFISTLSAGGGESVLQQGAHSVLNGGGNDAMQLPEEEVDQRVVERRVQRPGTFLLEVYRPEGQTAGA